MPTRTEIKRANARAALLDAARTVMAEEGAEGLRISDVTERADVGLGTFYSHFETKQDIVEAVLGQTFGAAADRIVDIAETLDDPAEAMSVGIRQIVQIAYDDREMAGVLLNLQRTDAAFESIVGPQALTVFERGIAEGRFDIDDAQAALTIAAGSVIAFMTAILDGRLGDDADQVCAAALLRSVGLGRDEALEITRRPLPGS